MLAVDVGGTGSRAVVVSDGEHRVSGPPLRVVDGRVRIEEVLDSLDAQLPRANHSFDAVVVGAAGVMALGDPAGILQYAARLWPARRTLVASDIVTSHFAVWHGGAGAVVAAGTGVTGLGTDFDTVWHRSDGWGQRLGDEGGGAWIGSRGLRAALRAVDRRPHGSDMLKRAAEERWGDLRGLPHELESAANPATFFASFAPAVVEAAVAGDLPSVRILASAGERLADTAVSVLSPGLPQRVALLGGVSDIGELVTRPFLEAVERRRPEAKAVVATAKPLDGALLLARSVLAGAAPASNPPYITSSQSALDTTPGTTQGES